MGKRRYVHHRTPNTGRRNLYDTKPTWMVVQLCGSHHITPRSTVYCVTQWKGHISSSPAESHSDPKFPHGTLEGLARPDVMPYFLTSSFYHLDSVTINMKNRQNLWGILHVCNLSLLPIIQKLTRFFHMSNKQGKGATLGLVSNVPSKTLKGKKKCLKYVYIYNLSCPPS